MPIMFRLDSPAPKEEVASASQIVPNDKPVIQDGEVFTVVEEMPQFPGGMAEAMKFLAKNINYPAEAQKAKIEGRVIVQFVVKKDGKIGDLKIVRGVHPDLDAEALRVVGMMPEWIPGKQRGQAVDVKYTMPIMFRLPTPAPKEETSSTPQMFHLKVEKGASNESVDMVKEHLRNPNQIVLRTGGTSGANSTDKILVVVDGVVKGKGQAVLNEISTDNIQMITVMKDDTAIAKYGEKGKDGVVEVTTKKK